MIDSHCHLADEEFAADLDAGRRRAREAAGSSRACASSRPATTTKLRAGGASGGGCGPRSAFAIGVHPHQAQQVRRTTPTAAARCVASASTRAAAPWRVGEIGLDYHYDFSPRDVQQEVFRAQLRLARELRPADRHSHARGRGRYAAHPRGGGRRRAARRLPLLHRRRRRWRGARAGPGFHVSFAGIVTFPQGRGAARCGAASCPRDRLLVETDSPFLAPVPHRGKRNEPAFVARVARDARRRARRRADDARSGASTRTSTRSSARATTASHTPTIRTA